MRGAQDELPVSVTASLGLATPLAGTTGLSETGAVRGGRGEVQQVNLVGVSMINGDFGVSIRGSKKQVTW